MQVSCPTCSKDLNLGDEMVGLRVNCPACGSSVQVPDEPDADILDSDDVAEELPAAELVSEDTKTCPMCGGTIKRVARKCRFCGEYLSDIPGEHDRGTFGVWRDGKRLVMSKDAQLPFICIKSNQPATGWLRRKHYWHHWAIYLTILISIWIYVIVALIVRKKADIQVGLSAEWFRRRLLFIAGGWLGFLAGVSLIIGGIAGARPGNKYGVPDSRRDPHLPVCRHFRGSGFQHRSPDAHHRQVCLAQGGSSRLPGLTSSLAR